LPKAAGGSKMTRHKSEPASEGRKNAHCAGGGSGKWSGARKQHAARLMAYMVWRIPSPQSPPPLAHGSCVAASFRPASSGAMIVIDSRQRVRRYLHG
jgi:hypothetical protein